MIAISTYSGECDGLGLAAEMAGIEVAAYCETDPKRRARLAKKHPGKPIFESDEELTANALRAHGIYADFIFGGPPCQPFSVAGNQRAESDPRHRWPEMLRFIQEYRPRWVLVENVGGFVNLALDLVCDDLEDEGYEVGAVVLPALAIGAPHRRDRCFVVGHAHGERCGEPGICDKQPGRTETIGTGEGMAYGPGHRRSKGRAELQGFGGVSESSGGGDKRMANAAGGGCRGGGDFGKKRHLPHEPFGKHSKGESEGNRGVCRVSEDSKNHESVDNPCGGRCSGQHWRKDDPQPADGYPWDGRAAESRLGRVLDGISHRLDEVKWPAWRGQAQHPWEPPRTLKNIPERPRRIESLGLAVVPWQAYPLMALIKEMDDILLADELRGDPP